MFIILWDVKEPAHLSQRVGHVVPGVVVCLLWYIMVGRVKRAHLVWSLALLCDPNLVPRSHSVTGNVRSGKVRFQACSVPARPEIRAFLSLRMFVLSVVILGDFAE